jgi:tellurite resistance protein
VSNDAEGLIKALGFVAWSDKRLAPEEREMLDNVMSALDIPAERRDALCKKLGEGPPSIESIGEDFSDEMERRFALAQAVMMAQADGHVDPAEKRDIDTLARALEIDADEVQMIMAAVEVTKDLVPDD